MVDDSDDPPVRRPSSMAPSPAELKKPPVARDYMDTMVPSIPPDMDIELAVDFLLEQHRTGAPVVDEEGRLVGILTEYDCLRLLTLGANHDHPEGTVADYMTTDVVTIAPHTDIYYVAGLFLRHHFRRLPVLHDGKLVGAITRFDVLRAIQLTRA